VDYIDPFRQFSSAMSYENSDAVEAAAQAFARLVSQNENVDARHILSSFRHIGNFFRAVGEVSIDLEKGKPEPIGAIERSHF
jgi:hypothetical protein